METPLKEKGKGPEQTGRAFKPQCKSDICEESQTVVQF